MTDLTKSRAEVLASFGATPNEVDELLFYNRNCFDLNRAAHVHFPLADESFIKEWEMYAHEVEEACSLTAIYTWLPQLQFPIQQDLRNRPEYIDAVTRGKFIYPGGISTGLDLTSPHLCRLVLHPTAAGRIPVVVAGSRSDFVTLIRAFTKKGEPGAVPDSMGAIIISSYNNFHRIHLLRKAHLESGEAEWAWSEKFQSIKQLKHLYQDRFVILSPGPYSGVPAAALQLAEDEWETISLAIRMNHECTHYFTRRVFDSMQNNLLDELIADYCGMDEAVGTYSADWALHFFGIEDELEYRPGGRLENYRGTPPLSLGAFSVLGRLVRAAVANLSRLNTAIGAWRDTDGYRVSSILTIASFTLEDLAKHDGWEDLVSRFHACITSQNLHDCPAAD